MMELISKDQLLEFIRVIRPSNNSNLSLYSQGRADIAGLIEKHISNMPVFDVSSCGISETGRLIKPIVFMIENTIDLHDQCIHGSVCGGDCTNCDDFER